MKQSIGSKSAPHARKHAPHGNKIHREVPPHPSNTPIISSGKEPGEEPDQPFVEGAQDKIDLDLRHRMISEVAYHRYMDRGYADGYDVDDWLQAEAEVDRLLLIPGLQSGPQSAA
jgi:hypothetical protein